VLIQSQFGYIHQTNPATQIGEILAKVMKHRLYKDFRSMDEAIALHLHTEAKTRKPRIVFTHNQTQAPKVTEIIKSEVVLMANPVRQPDNEITLCSSNFLRITQVNIPTARAFRTGTFLWTRSARPQKCPKQNGDCYMREVTVSQILLDFKGVLDSEKAAFAVQNFSTRFILLLGFADSEMLLSLKR
jgi:hypothetical protein